MKKALAALVILSMLLGAVALAEAADAAGTWYLIEMVEDGQSINPADLGLTITLTLNDDGSAVMDSGEGMEGTWTQDGDSVIVTIDGDAMDFALADGTLTAAEDDMTMVFSRDTVEGFAPAAVVEATAIEDFNGTWEAYKAGIMGMYIDVEQLGENVSVTIENGVVSLGGSMFEDSEDTQAIEMNFVDGVLSMAVDEENGGSFSFQLLEDGNLVMTMNMDEETSFDFYLAPAAAEEAAA